MLGPTTPLTLHGTHVVVRRRHVAPSQPSAHLVVVAFASSLLLACLLSHMFGAVFNTIHYLVCIPYANGAASCCA